MQEACFNHLPHMVVRGPGGTADPTEPLKQATDTVLWVLGNALRMQVLVGSGSKPTHELTGVIEPMALAGGTQQYIF